MTRPNNVTTNYAYDNLSRLQSVLQQLAGSTIDGAAYTVDNAGNRTAKTDQRAAVTSNYGYDAIYELTSVTQGTNTTESYTYNPVGNRMSSLGVSPYSYNTSNELNSTPTTSYTYDSNGSTTSKMDSTGTTQYTWDFENRLASVALPGTSGTVTFRYDPFGRRIQKSFTTGANPPTTTTTNYLYDGYNSIEEVDPNGIVLARYSQGMNIDEPLANLRNGATSYYHADGLGSVTSLSNSAGALAQTYAFDSFGKQTASSGSLTNPFRYTGREFDSETSLYFYRARYYDSVSGRFLSEDPLRWKSAANFYEYVNNNPINASDPLGLIACKDCDKFVRYCYWTATGVGILGTWGCRLVCTGYLKTPLTFWVVCAAGGATVNQTLRLGCFAGYLTCKKKCDPNCGSGFGGQDPQTGGAPQGGIEGGGGGGFPTPTGPAGGGGGPW